MRITFLSPPGNLGGGSRVIAIHAAGLQRLGHEVSILTSTAPTPSRLRRVAQLLGLSPTPALVESHFDRVDVPVRLVPGDAVTAEDAPDADVIVATWWETAEWLSSFPASKGAKAYFVQGYEIFPGLPAERVKATWRLPFQKIAVSGWLKDIASDEFGDPDVICVPNAVDHAQFHAPPRGKQARPTLGFLYSRSTVKGIDLALRAAERVREQIPSLAVVCFSTEEPSLEHPLPAGAEFTRNPPQALIRELYARCDVWISASRSEGFGLTTLEAMACRCPVVATRVGGPVDFIVDGENGFLTEVEDVDALVGFAQQILQLDEPAWSRLSHAAYETARTFTWSDSTARFEAALRETVERERRRAKT